MTTGGTTSTSTPASDGQERPVASDRARQLPGCRRGHQRSAEAQVSTTVWSPEGRLIIRGTIIWVNGYFGVGKTTTVEHVTQRLSGAVIFDPEQIGFLLRRSVPVPSGDFRDLPAWRHLVAESIVAIMGEHHDHGTDGCLLVPMSLTNGRHRADIFDVLRDAGLTVHEFFLTARRDELEHRITDQVLFADDPARDEAARQWRLAQLDAAAAALPGLEPKPRILDTTSVSPAEVADAIVEEPLVGS